MFERFTEKALRVILLAQEEARKTGHNFVGTEQILIGLIEEGSGIGSKALKENGLKVSEVRKEINKLIGKGSGFIAVEIPFTPRAKSILEQSLQQARAFNHSYIGTEHMLLALLDDTEGIAIQILTKLKVNIYKIRRALLEELGQVVDPVFIEMQRKEEEKEKRIKEYVEKELLTRAERQKKRVKEKRERIEKTILYLSSLEKYQKTEQLEPLLNVFNSGFSYDPKDLGYYFEEGDEDEYEYQLHFANKEENTYQENNENQNIDEDDNRNLYTIVSENENYDDSVIFEDFSDENKYIYIYKTNLDDEQNNIFINFDSEQTKNLNLEEESEFIRQKNYNFDYVNENEDTNLENDFESILPDKKEDLQVTFTEEDFPVTFTYSYPDIYINETNKINFNNTTSKIDFDTTKEIDFDINNKIFFEVNDEIDSNENSEIDPDINDEVQSIIEKIKKENFSEESRGMLLENFDNMFKKKSGEPIIDTPALKEFTTNLSELALDGEIDPVIGRKKEVERVVQILSRRRKNNPILIGEPGVGKTAVAEGLALKICNQEVATCLSDKEVVVLDVSSLLAGTKYRGEFEERIKRIMYEIKIKKNVILVIDEVHTIVGAGAAEGSLDAANILKPALARGELQCIGATTLDEYKQIEKDPALERRFQSVLIAEPTKEESFQILKGLRQTYENFHQVRLPDLTLKACVDLSSLYIKDRFLPDKAIDLIDEASSKLKISNLYPSSKKPYINDLEQRLIEVLREKDFLLRSQDFERAAKLRDKEMLLRNQIRGFLYSIKASQKEIKSREQLPIVSVDHINEILTSWTGIPLTKVEKEEAKKLLDMEKEMGKRVIGQKKAVTAICSAIRRARVGMRNPNRPIASFLFCGPTGVGKTELTKTLAESFFGSSTAMFRFDMSEYMERHTVAKLIGSPPGYVGYNEGGQLTEAVRRKPFSLVLFDEVEKAHPDIFNLFLQLLDDGRLTDSKGKTIDFTNTIIIMTSNLGSKYIDSELTKNEKEEYTTENSFLGDSIEKKIEPKFKKTADGYEYNDPELDIFRTNLLNSSEKIDDDQKDEEESNKIEELVKNEIKKFFRPEFINRIDEIIIFERLKRNNISEICDIMLKEIHKRLLERNIFIDVNEQAKDYIIDQGYDPAYGAREIRRSLLKYLEDEVTATVLKTQVITLRAVVLVEYDKYRKVHSFLYPLPSFVLSPINKDMINNEENQRAILAFIKVIKEWKEQYLRPEKYLIHYYSDDDMYEETEEEEQKRVEEKRQEIRDKLDKLIAEDNSKKKFNKYSKVLVNKKNNNLDD